MINISHIKDKDPIKIIIGASSQAYSGWNQTQKAQLDLLKKQDWELSFKDRRIDAILSEHVWEHLTENEGRIAAEICYDFLKPNGYLRCAVPDGYFLNEAYQNLVKIGGPGPKEHPAASHKIVYNYQSLTEIFESVGFEVSLLEYCDQYGVFHFEDWNPEEGFIYRSKRFDHRNKTGELKMISLIIDAKKPHLANK